MGWDKLSNNHSTLYDRVKKLLVSYEWSDCNFLVLGKYFKAHKLILSTSSPVFEAMLYGPLSTNDDIIITDIEPDTFHQLLTYIYTDNIEITCVEQAFELLYAAKKYFLEYLSELCVAYVQSNLSVDNVMTVLNYPDYIQEKSLYINALNLFCEHADYLLKEHKAMISHSSMKALLQREEINLPEKDLISHVIEWTSFYCEQNNLAPTIQNRLAVLYKDGLLDLIRFNVLCPEDINSIVKILNPLESEYMKTVLQTKMQQSFQTTLPPRTKVNMQWQFCHRTPMRSVAPVTIGLNNNTVVSKIKCDKTVFIKSLTIPTRSTPGLNFYSNPARLYSEQICITIAPESDIKNVKNTNFFNSSKYDSLVDIELSEPCMVKKDEWYKICFQWPQTGSDIANYSVECRYREYVDNRIKFEFEDSNISRIDAVGSFLIGLRFCM